MADVICPSCNERFHETTDRYNPDVPPNGSMFRLKRQYVENGWSSFIEDESTIQDNLCCPECGGSYREGNPARVRVDKDQYISELREMIAEAEKARDFHIDSVARHVEKARTELSEAANGPENAGAGQKKPGRPRKA